MLQIWYTWKGYIKNIEDTTFIIRNNNSKKKVLRITIQEVTDYDKYNTSRLDPQFVKFQATVGDNYISASRLTDNTWVDSDGVLNYVIYDGTISAKETQKVALSLYVDYAPLDNSYQNKGFIGTIKIYVEDDTVTTNWKYYFWQVLSKCMHFISIYVIL